MTTPAPMQSVRVFGPYVLRLFQRRMRALDSIVETKPANMLKSYEHTEGRMKSDKEKGGERGRERS